MFSKEVRRREARKGRPRPLPIRINTSTSMSSFRPSTTTPSKAMAPSRDQKAV